MKGGIDAEAGLPHGRLPDFWLTATAAALFAAAWLATHRYSGLWHDAVLYAAQSLRRIDPGAFRGDIFFTYGSQDQYTVFTAIYATAIRWLDLPLAATVLLATAHALWIIALIAVFRHLLRERSLWFALMLVAVLPSNYGSGGVFSYAETFLTARIWSEATALLAIAFALGAHPRLALAALFLTATLHPPMALPAAIFVAVAGFPRHMAIWLAGTATTVLIALAIAGIGPFGQLLVTMDDAWLQIANERSSFAFVAQWPAHEFHEPLLLCLILATAAARAEGAPQRAWIGGLAAFVVGAALSLLTVIWPSALVVQLQPWRMLWLVKILAIAAAVWLLRELWPRTSFARLLLAGMAGAILTVDNGGLFAACVIAPLLIAHQRMRLDISLHRIVPVIAWATVAAIAVDKAADSVMVGAAAFAVHGHGTQAISFFHFIAQTSWFLFPAIGAAAWWTGQRWPRSRHALAVTAAAFAAYCGMHWNAPAAREREAFSHWQDLAGRVAEHAPYGSLMYWEDGVDIPWLGLRRANYVSPTQGAGVIFSAATAHEFMRRSSRAAGLNPGGALVWRRSQQVPMTTMPRPTGVAAAAGLRHLCGDTLLDHVVLGRIIGGMPVQRIPAGHYGGPFYLYDCTSLRNPPPPRD